ncbi:MAG: DNA adenine methylase [Candidatus Thermoplasmatota archaeon]|jgi:DNA adenine methylase|nr:DNA adenine methylase [Candidatus Thermoplasmatota archaeon]
MLKPLVKWAGGKRQIIREMISLVPWGWNRYVEPFVGGGALLVELYNIGLLNGGLISDMNCELTNLYQVVKFNTEELLDFLKSFRLENNRDYYSMIRKRFNEIRGDNSKKVERSILFMALNRLSFNGLWRVNSAGKFNVPFGRYRDPALPGFEHVKAFSTMLTNIEIVCQDFEKTCNQAEEGDFVYLDPPYLPLSSTSFFTDYTPGGFSMKDQQRLLGVCKKLSGRGIKFLLSNSFSQEIKDLYSEYNIHVIPARRSINSIGSGRIGQSELLITNY